MEGVSQEAASLAGHLRLGKLIYLYDMNHISLAGAEIDFTEDVAKRFQACGWHTRVVPDGNDTEDVASAIREAQAEEQGPSLILARTHIGYDSLHKQDNFTAHGDPLGEDELQATKKALGWPTMDRFYVPQDSVEFFRQAVPHGAQMEDEWRKKFDAYKQAFPKEAAEFESVFSAKLPPNWDADLPKWKPSDKPMATPGEHQQRRTVILNRKSPSLRGFVRGGAKNPGVARGAYVLADVEGGSPDVILIGTGSEVGLCVPARERLRDFGVKARGVSMPSMNLFEAQEDSYRESVLPQRIKKRVTVEAGSPLGWHRWAGDEGSVIGLERFGASAPGQEVLAHLGFTADHVAAAAVRLVGKNNEADLVYGSEPALVTA